MDVKAILTTPVDQVRDKHDDLGPEKIPLEDFVTLLTYDPPFAEQDDSVVLREYKAKSNQLKQVTTEAGPSGTTRNAS